MSEKTMVYLLSHYLLNLLISFAAFDYLFSPSQPKPMSTKVLLGKIYT